MAILLFLLGLIVGSFLNVIGLRWNSGLGIRGRSFCPACHKHLRYYELIPVLSFLFLGGRCRRCKSGISLQYPLIEVFTGLVFSSLYYVLNPDTILLTTYYLLLTIVFCIYILILIYDFRHKIIPDQFVYASMVLAVIARIVAYYSLSATDSLLDWFSGPIIFAFFAVIWLITRGKAMGLGDAKLGLSLGLLLGAAQGFSAIVLSFWIGSVVALALLFLFRIKALFKDSKRLTMKSEIPFAPFMVIGAWLSYIFSLDLLHVSIF